ncbi:hypothetical protein L2E82_15416 [Cichorium intybus]|uniref:Uncharacterized protein n=1 Tax=Cichorium intybus TaxID=13427 RepID=A0ACB9F234_CICIN|nr:hypothetical protein L2E82_15416 [Cichorium intybus]
MIFFTTPHHPKPPWLIYSEPVEAGQRYRPLKSPEPAPSSCYTVHPYRCRGNILVSSRSVAPPPLNYRRPPLLQR